MLELCFHLRNIDTFFFHREESVQLLFHLLEAEKYFLIQNSFSCSEHYYFWRKSIQSFKIDLASSERFSLNLSILLCIHNKRFYSSFPIPITYLRFQGSFRMYHNIVTISRIYFNITYSCVQPTYCYTKRIDRVPATRSELILICFDALLFYCQTKKVHNKLKVVYIQFNDVISLRNEHVESWTNNIR